MKEKELPGSYNPGSEKNTVYEGSPIPRDFFPKQPIPDPKDLDPEDIDPGHRISLGELFKQIKQENPIFRLSKRTLNITFGMRPNPDRLALTLLVLLSAGMVINLGRQVIDNQARIAAMTASASETLNLVPSTDSSGDEPKLDIIPPRPNDLIRQYMEEHINNNLVGRAEKFDKLWGITTTEFVQIYLEEDVDERNFPDSRLGRITGRLQYEQGKPLEGLFMNFIVVQDPKTQDLSIWAVRWNTFSGNKPRLRVLEVYSGGKWRASFINEEGAVSGKAIEGEILFGQAYPPVEIPKFKSIVL